VIVLFSLFVAVSPCLPMEHDC